MKKVLILCTGNSCRSQIAQGYLTRFAGDVVKVYSAGIETHGVNPRAIETMKEDGVDISHQTSNNIKDYRGIHFDYVITVCDNAQENCPTFPSGPKQFHHNFPDPAKATGSEADIMEQFRLVREEIKAFCKKFAEDQLS